MHKVIFKSNNIEALEAIVMLKTGWIFLKMKGGMVPLTVRNRGELGLQRGITLTARVLLALLIIHSMGGKKEQHNCF